MITKDVAVSLRLGATLYHESVKDARGEPARARVTGVCKTWKTRPADFKLPVKYGLCSSFYIESGRNDSEWRV